RQQAAAVLGEQAALQEGDPPPEPADAAFGKHPSRADLLQEADLDLEARDARLAPGVMDDGMRHRRIEPRGNEAALRDPAARMAEARQHIEEKAGDAGLGIDGIDVHAAERLEKGIVFVFLHRAQLSRFLRYWMKPAFSATRS